MTPLERSKESSVGVSEAYAIARNRGDRALSWKAGATDVLWLRRLANPATAVLLLVRPMHFQGGIAQKRILGKW